MAKSKVIEFANPAVASVKDTLTEVLRTGARRLLQQGIELEVEAMLAGYVEQRDGAGRQTVVRNGYLPEREILTGIGPVAVRVPKVRTRGDRPAVFHSALVPPYVRKSKSVEAALPWLYLKGVAAGQMREALSVLVGPEAQGLSAGVVSRLKATWQKEYRTWRECPLGQERWVYLWADGIYNDLRGDAPRLCVLVVIGVNERGEKHFLAIEDGVRESTQSWREVLLKLKDRGLMLAPKLAVGDGALGFWAALREIYPETREQRCWVHKAANVLNYLPKAVQPKAKQALQAIWMAPDREHAERAFDLFVATYEAKYPKAAQCLVKDREALLTFYGFPAEHWMHLRTSNPIESVFSTVRHRSDQAQGAFSRDTFLALLFKLGQSAEKRWRRIRRFEHLAKVITGVRFTDGVEDKESGVELSRQAA